MDGTLSRCNHGNNAASCPACRPHGVDRDQDVASEGRAAPVGPPPAPRLSAPFRLPVGLDAVVEITKGDASYLVRCLGGGRWLVLREEDLSYLGVLALRGDYFHYLYASGNGPQRIRRLTLSEWYGEYL